MIKNKENLLEVVAHDYKVPLIRSYIFTKSFLDYKKILKISNPIMGIISRNGTIGYAGNTNSWIKAHEELKKQVEEDYNTVDKIIDKTNEIGEEANEWAKEKISDIDLTKLKEEEIISLLDTFIEKQSLIYTYGTYLPTLDFHNFSFIEGNLNKILKEKLKEEYAEAYNAFTFPSNNSFSQDQEEDLLKLMNKYSPSFSSIKSYSISEIKIKLPDFYAALKEHTKKYCWVYYVYEGPAFTEDNFLEFIKDYIKRGINPHKRLEEINAQKEKIKKMKEKYIKKIKPNEFELFILNITGKMVWAKPRRKDYQSHLYYQAEKLLKEIARRLYITLKQARNCPPDMLKQALIGKTEIDTEYINSAINFHIAVPSKQGIEALILIGGEAEKFYKDKVKDKEENIDTKGINKLQGVCACSGKAKGKVKIINIPEDMVKMSDGDILVSTATTPSIVPAMKKAAAILTDEGGLTCHAAIVSRELNIPCVVGLKFITRVLKDGDEVEVDADKGVVKILERNK